MTKLTNLNNPFNYDKTQDKEYGKDDGQQVKILINKGLDPRAEKVNKQSYQKEPACPANSRT